MSRTPSWFRTILPSPGHAAVGATVAGTVLTGLAAAPERMGRLFRRRFPVVAVTGKSATASVWISAGGASPRRTISAPPPRMNPWHCPSRSGSGPPCRSMTTASHERPSIRRTAAGATEVKGAGASPIQITSAGDRSPTQASAIAAVSAGRPRRTTQRRWRSGSVGVATSVWYHRGEARGKRAAASASRSPRAGRHGRRHVTME